MEVPPSKVGGLEFEEEFRKAGGRFSSIFQAMREGCWIVDPEYNIQFVNNRLAEIFGYSAEDMVGKKSYQFFDPANREMLEQRMELRRQGISEQYDYCHIRKDGGKIWVLLSGSPYYDDEGNFAGAVGLFTDITKRKEAEEELRDSEERFRNLIEGSVQGLIIHTDKPLFVNQSAADLFGYDSPREMLGLENIAAIFSPEERDKVRANRIARLGGEEVPTHYQFKGLRKDGSPVWVDTSVRVVNWEGVQAIQCTYNDITDQKEAEDSLKESQRLLQTVFDTVPHWMFVKDADARFLMVNRHYADYFTLHPDDFTGKKYGEINRFSDQFQIEQSDESDRKVLRQGGITVFQTEFLGPGGDTTHRRVIKLPLRDGDGTITGLVGISEDITERVEAEISLRTSELKFRDLAEKSLQGFLVHREHEILFANQALADIFGYDSPEEIQEMDSRKLVAPHEVPRLRKMYLARLRGENVRTRFEFEGVCKDGSQVFIDTITDRILWDGEPAILSVRNDISKRRQALEDLKESQRLLRTVFDSLPQWVHLKDTQGRIVVCNEAFGEYIGKPPKELEGMTTEEYIGDQNDLSQIIVSADRLVREKGRKTQLPPLTRLHLDGTEHIHQSTKIPIENDLDEIVGILTVTEDITEAVQNQERLKDLFREQELMQAQLMEVGKTAAMGELAAGIAHEINNPLAIIASSVELLQDKLSEPSREEQHGGGEFWDRHLGKINNTVFRCKDIVQSLLVFSRRESELMGNVDLCELMITTLGLMKNSSLARYRTFHIICPLNPGGGREFQGSRHCAECPTKDELFDFSMRTSRQQVEQVYLNLLLNAVQATEDGGKIRISVAKKDGGIEISIRDDGTGIEPEDIARIFDPFFTTKPPGLGTGLGLSLSRRIIQSLGGQIAVESSPGNGALFRVWLPQDRESLQDQLEPPGVEAS